MMIGPVPALTKVKASTPPLDEDQPSNVSEPLRWFRARLPVFLGQTGHHEMDLGPDDQFGDSNRSRSGPKPGRSFRSFSLPGGGLAILILLVGGLVWVAHHSASRPTVRSIQGSFQRLNYPIDTLAFTPDGRFLATGDTQGALKILDQSGGLDHPRVIEAGPCPAVRSAVFSPDGGTLASGGDGPDVTLWDVASGKLRATLKGTGSLILKLAFTPDGKTLALGHPDGGVTLQDVKTGRELSHLDGGFGELRGLAFSPDGKSLAVGSFRGHVRIWDVALGRDRDTLILPDRTVESLAFAPDGKHLGLALGSRRPEVAIWTIGGGREAIRVLGQASFACVAFSPDGKTLAASCEEAVVKLWDVETGREFARLEGHTGYIRAIAFSPDGRFLATGSMDTLVGLFPINLDELKAGRP